MNPRSEGPMKYPLYVCTFFCLFRVFLYPWFSKHKAFRQYMRAYFIRSTNWRSNKIPYVRLHICLFSRLTGVLLGNCSYNFFDFFHEVRAPSNLKSDIDRFLRKNLVMGFGDLKGLKLGFSKFMKNRCVECFWFFCILITATESLQIDPNRFLKIFFFLFKFDEKLNLRTFLIFCIKF